MNYILRNILECLRYFCTLFTLTSPDTDPKGTMFIFYYSMHIAKPCTHKYLYIYAAMCHTNEN